MTLQLPGPFAKSAEIFASTKNDCDEYDGSDSAAQSQQAEDRLPGHGVQKFFILCTENQAYVLGVNVRNMKMDFNTGGTRRWVGQ